MSPTQNAIVAPDPGTVPGLGPAEPRRDQHFAKALVFTPHPDDAELGCGATMARWASEGTEVVLCVVTNGAMGSNDPAVARADLIATREAEQRAAAAVIGVSEVVFLGHEDGYVEDNHELRRDMIREIRRHRPDVVVGPDPSMYYFGQQYVNHPDHRRVGEAFLAAVNRGATTVPLYRTELYDRGFEPHQVKAALLALSINGDYFVDAEGFLELKLKALRTHVSQMADWAGLEEFVTGMAAMIGKSSGQGLTYAESFKAFFFD
jgi:LmbE family N-acetylglucosaminyl deacetylase